MKKGLLILFILAFTGFTGLRSQTVELTGFGGYVLPARWNAYNGSLYFYGNAMYGGSINLGVSRVLDVGFSYTRIDTEVSPESFGSLYYFDNIPVSQNYYMLGFTKNFRVNDKVSPYLRFNLGGVYLSPKESQYYSYWFFAMGADGGVKVYFAERVGLMAQMSLLMPVQYGGFYFYGGTGGSGAGVSMSGTLVDFGFTGGLLFRIGKLHY